MARSPGESTPGTQTVPGQTPTTEVAPPPAPAHPEVLQGLLDRFPECTVPAWRYADGIPTASVPAARLVEICTWLRDQSQPRFELLIDVCGAHWPTRELPFEVSYILHALATNDRLRLKCSTGGETPTLPSIIGVFPAANWPEREIYDMFGVTFDGHPDLRRLLMPNDWEGHPLRKDFPLGEEPVEFYRPPAITPSVSAEAGGGTGTETE
ncbi:MAG TPA: NADH-quinone oxidoreductase subunit C [Chloroflexota bacterium]|jgi:NADH-quinone oxidoreductase subunit C|nr:NADH-quinone oxidoreductase subunit C [Chloroflexota bacterium]